MKLLNNPIVNLPKDLQGTELYNLLKLFDDKILEIYQVNFNKDDEFPAVKKALEYFYSKPERLDDGNLDETALEIDLNYITWLVQSCKSTREFSKILFDGNFNLESVEGVDPRDSFVKLDPDNHMNILVSLNEISGDSLTEVKENITSLLNHLLYFHNIVDWCIEVYTQIVEIYQKDKNSYLFRNINSIYYDCGNRV